ncbi:TetR/AcrR family transcriptional regulator [Nocardia sp. NBC_00508]|uniref:TetR/AcrR family transcriptional regulator n=1 Tax=Nocardia sp. NBC_00508 TaxID=2975992 RepID=UPI002E804F53|nr:TetR/AcrR family transcriptional regulator [Nocardia sp. NBC_00508]WUD68699.1 TetR/AcrR family transcriptional regulator [Nocardia sp. NBC_00508]
MPSPTSQPQRTGRPARISRAEIVSVANAVIDAEGVEKLTMRRLAAELSCTPMALYHHVRDKEDLLRLLLNDYADQVVWPDLPEDPQERIRIAAQAMHDVLAARPWIVEILAADDLFGVSALWVSESIIDGFVACGLSLERAVQAYRTIWHYTAGDLIVRARSTRRAAENRATFRAQVFADLDTETYPRLATLGPDYLTLTTQNTYEPGLRALITGLLS